MPAAGAGGPQGWADGFTERVWEKGGKPQQAHGRTLSTVPGHPSSGQKQVGQKRQDQEQQKQYFHPTLGIQCCLFSGRATMSGRVPWEGPEWGQSGWTGTLAHRAAAEAGRLTQGEDWAVEQKQNHCWGFSGASNSQQGSGG